MIDELYGPDERVLAYRGHLATDPDMFRAVLAGHMPAEALGSKDRRVLMRLLVSDGLTDRDIEALTRWTLYTVVRIREAMYLEPNTTPQLERTA
jgi:hypothetical protein